jgi:predicted anti-sigma-YlaC factor YlaD
MKTGCEEIRMLLVDYADGELSGAEGERVTAHLTECPACRELVEGLRKSLGLAEVVWNDNAAEVEKIAGGRIPRVRRVSWRRYVAAAAGIVVIGAICLMQLREEPAVESPQTFEEIDRKISDVGSAARILAATELLAESGNFKDIVQQQYRYIVERYPETPAGVEAQLRIQ